MKNENEIEKSAILKGQTLKAITDGRFERISTTRYPQGYQMDESVATFEDCGTYYKSTIKKLGTINVNGEDSVTSTNPSFCEIILNNPIEIKKGETYTLYIPRVDSSSYEKELLFRDGEQNYNYTPIWSNEECFVFTAIYDCTQFLIYQNFKIPESEKGKTVSINVSKRAIIVEGDHRNENIPPSIGMGLHSVKMPVLTTIGKNLFDMKHFAEETNKKIKNPIVIGDNSLVITSTDKLHHCYKYRPINFESNKQYVLSANIETDSSEIGTVLGFAHTDGSYTFISKDKQTLTSTEGKTVDYITTSYGSHGTVETWTNIQLEEGSTPTSYEPYQSNILTVNEEVELRGFGGVRDELNLITGELTQSIGEIVLNGSEGWEVADTGNINRFYLFPPLNNISNNTSMSATSIISDKLPTISQNQTNDVGIINWWNGTNSNINIRSTIKTIAEFKVWLSQNPITVQYPLATESIKTVDLTITDQDNQPQERMKLFPTGYINTSSSTFPPILELKGITHNNKLNMATTNGTNNTQLTTLDNLVLDGIICYDGTVVRDSYDVESGLYTKRVFRFTIDKDFIERYRDKFSKVSENTKAVELNMNTTAHCKYPSPSVKGTCNNIEYSHAGARNRVAMSSNQVWITLVKEEL